MNFEIDQQGRVTVKHSLDYEKTETLSVIILAIDRGN